MRLARRQRTVAAILASLWIVAPVAAALHATVHQHRYCAEHKAFEHGGLAADPGASDLDGVVAGGGQSEAGHESCAFASFTSRDGSLDGAAHVLPASLHSGHRPLPDGTCDSHPIPLLSFAPKSSPPLAG